MRNVLLGLVATTLFACGVFGSSDDSPSAPTPEDNATPPPVGGEAPVGIYVSSSQGQDDGSGSSVRPLKTLARAFALAKQQGARVIACAEEYPENVTLLDGVSAYGYYDCKKTPWERGAPRAVVRAPASPAMIATGINQPTRIEGFEVRSPDLDGAPATETTGTTVALEARDSAGLVLGEVLLHAGKGAAGTDGIEGQVNTRTATSNGSDALDQGVKACNPGLQNCGALRILGPAGGVTTCAIGPSGGAGGQAGDGRFYADGVESTGALEFRGRALAATAATAIGGLNSSVLGLDVGRAGQRGANGAEGTDGANVRWSLTSSGFVRGNGTRGGAGSAGQGGGGGAGTKANFTPAGGVISPPQVGFYATATGGGGGGGGCGGQPGTPGTGGGASIGALLIASTVTIERTRIETAEGGRAGKGNLGTAGIVGGTGGAGTVHTIATTGAGGDGGPGGSGGASGHGAPGPSIALAWSKTKPALTMVDLVPGAGGAGQPALSRVVGGTIGTKMLAGVTGESKAEHEITQ